MSGLLRAAVIGVGAIGSLHARIYADNPRCELVGVADTDAATAQRVGAELGVAAYDSHEALLAAHDVDAVSIAVPEQHRYEPSMASAGADAALLLEKPLAPDLAGASRLVQGLAAHDRTVMVNFPLRSDPRYLRAQQLASTGELGELCTLFARRRGTAAGAEIYGPWTDLLISTAIHDLDAMSWIAGAPAERVYAEAVVKRCAEWGHADAVVATVRFANGVVAALETSWVLPSTVPDKLSTSFQVVGTGGAVTVEGANHGLAVVTEDGYELPDMAHWPTGRTGIEGALRASVDHFVGCALTGAAPVVGLADAVAAQRIVAAIKRAIAKVEPVDLADLDGDRGQPN